MVVDLKIMSHQASLQSTFEKKTKHRYGDILQKFRLFLGKRGIYTFFATTLE